MWGNFVDTPNRTTLMLPQLNVQIIVVQFELLSINQLIIIRLNNTKLSYRLDSRAMTS